MNISSIKFIKSFLTFFMVFSVVVMPIAASFQLAFADSMSSGDYKIQSDDVNFGGGESSSASYSIQDTQGGIASGDQQSTDNTLHAGYQQAGTTSGGSSGSSSTPSTGGSSGGSSGSSQSSLPINVLNFTATPQTNSIDLTWMYPTGSDISSVRIVRSSKFFPGDISDGDIIFQGSAPRGDNNNVGEIIDHDVVPGVQYYYAIFAQNSIGLYSSGVLAQAVIAVAGQPVSPSNPSEVFQNVPSASNINPIIASLTLLDFDFIQDGIKIVPAGNTIPIDGTKNLTIQLAYDKVPEILKTIAMTLTDPSDSTKVFTFLLRVNADKTAYSATIAPLGKSGDYQLNAIILDYQNQGLKRLNGDLKALVLDASQSLFADGNTADGIYAMFIFLALAFLAIVWLVHVERRKRNPQKKPLAGGPPIFAEGHSKLLPMIPVSTPSIPPDNLPQ